MLSVLALSVFLLATVGVFLLLHRSLLRVVLGLGCISHAVNLIVLSAGRMAEHAPLVVEGVTAQEVSDPVPQAFVLTAIVISMAFTLYLLAGMAVQARRGGVPEWAAPAEGDGDPASE
ncbi:MAG: sodium:proton antiporter, partial [Myxococcota bacterium]